MALLNFIYLPYAIRPSQRLFEVLPIPFRAILYTLASLTPTRPGLRSRKGRCIKRRPSPRFKFIHVGS